MLQTEFVRSLNCNYERILLEKKPEENKYQYCIVTRGGIRGLLPCSLRYINGQAYLYYDISSTQSIVQLHAGKCIGRQWIGDFLWGMRKIRQELERFLLDDGNLIWHPEQIFQDLEKNEFYFLYVPYHEGENNFKELLDYLVEHIDYNDQQLVDCMYKIHEQYYALGDVYLREQIYEDGAMLEKKNSKESPEGLQTEEREIVPDNRVVNYMERENVSDNGSAAGVLGTIRKETKEMKNEKDARKGLRYFLEGKLKRQKEGHEVVRYDTDQVMMRYAVCEETEYTRSSGQTKEEETEDEFGRTIYMEENKKVRDEYCRLFDDEGKEVFVISQQTTVLGKKKDEADCVIDHPSVSRMHARITGEKEGYYLEDLNSTNGTYKNGLRLLPYEKRKLNKEDEIKLGKIALHFR